MVNTFINGVNLGNWLVLEKWMNPALFGGTTADDEYYLPTQLDPVIYEARIKIHRAEYITERDFATIKSWGLSSVRIPVPYFIFGDRPPFIGCIEELDKAFNWAEKYGLSILIDLHTAPMSQNGFDNGGLSGVCKWAQLPDEVEFVLTVLERLAQRYGTRKALMGIEVINEPNTTASWDSMNVTERYKAVDPEMAEGTGPIEFDWLKDFYMTAYRRLRGEGGLPEDKAVVFHDGFDIYQWKEFFTNPGLKNVILDTHQYLMMAEIAGCPQTAEGYDEFVRNTYAPMIAEVSEYVPVIVGEWCLFNSAARVVTGAGSPVAPSALPTSYEDIFNKETAMLHNPIFKGFNPDPAICRKGDDCYVAILENRGIPRLYGNGERPRCVRVRNRVRRYARYSCAMSTRVMDRSA